MHGCLKGPYPGFKRCLAIVFIAFPSVKAFPFTGISSHQRYQRHRLHLRASQDATTSTAAFQFTRFPAIRSSCRSHVATTRRGATLAPVEEKLEEKRAQLPAWELIPMHGTFDKLEQELTRHPFTDEAWQKSSELLRALVVDLANCVIPFSEHPYLPMQHAAALSLVGRLMDRYKKSGEEQGAEGVPLDLYSSLKYSAKKNGVARAAADVAGGFCPEYSSGYDRLLVTRGVERCLAEVSLVWSTARLLETCAPPETKRDFIFHLKALLEHAPARDRHEAVLILCRGLFTPGHNDAASRVYDNVHGTALRPQEGGYSLTEAFSEVQRGTLNNPGGLRAARQAFPFLEMLARWAWRCKAPEATKKKSSTKSFGKKKKKKEEKGVQGVRGGSELGGETLTETSSTATPVGATDGVEQEDDRIPPAGEEVEEERGEDFRARTRGDTGVASLLVALARADPSGDTIRSMQRWACEAILPDEVAEAESNTAVDRNEVVQGVISTHDIFVAGQKGDRQRWMKSCREIGEVLRILVGAMDEERLEGADVTSMVNHALFVTTFLRSMPRGVAARKGYEHLIAGGRVPGDTKGLAVSDVSTRVKNWREAAKILDTGIATVLKVSEDTVQSDAFRRALSIVLTTWQSPYALADYYVMHRKEREVLKTYVRFLRALLGVSDETVRDIRTKDPSNREHMQHFPKNVRQLWEAEPSTLRGTMDPEVIFRMGEDTRSCMGIRRSCSAQNRALLGYLLQGNVRLVGVQSPLGRMEARAVLRLLLRSDSMAPALFMDTIYYSSYPDTSLEQQVVAEARSVSEALGVPLYRAGDKIPTDRKPSSISEEEDDDQHWVSQESSSGSGMSVNSATPEMCELVEMDGLSAWVYSEGAVGNAHNPGLLYRDPYPGSLRNIVLAELEYADVWDDFAEFSL